MFFRRSLRKTQRMQAQRDLYVRTIKAMQARADRDLARKGIYSPDTVAGVTIPEYLYRDASVRDTVEPQEGGH